MIPASYDITVYQGDTYLMVFTLSNPASGTTNTPGIPVDLTGCTSEFRVRTVSDYSAHIIFDVRSWSATARNSIITLGGAAGTITLNFTPQDTVLLTSGVYDLKVTYPGGVVQTYLAGSFKVTQTGS